MPPEERFVCRFAAEPPQEGPASGRWADTLQAEFLAACLRIDAEGEDLGEAGVPTWFPDRSWNGRTYVPVTARTSTGLELFGYVSFAPGDPEGDGDAQEPSDFAASADFTDELAEAHPEWRMDLCDEVIGRWRGEAGHAADMTLVWGVPQIRGGTIATAELADLCVDQCLLVDDRFTLIAPDAYRQDFLEIKLFNVRGEELARESLYAEEGDEEEDDGEADSDERRTSTSPHPPPLPFAPLRAGRHRAVPSPLRARCLCASRTPGRSSRSPSPPPE